MRTIFSCIAGLLIGLIINAGVQHLLNAKIARQLRDAVNKCYVYADDRSYTYFEKVISVDKSRVRVVYTFLHGKAFIGHWCVLQGMGPEVIDARTYFRRMRETKCPW